MAPKLPMPDMVRKRDGRLAPWNDRRIFNAVWAAVKAVGGKAPEPARRVAEAVRAMVADRYAQDRSWIPTVEEIQEMVETALIKAGHDQVAKAYIRYRQQRTRARNIRQALLDVRSAVKTYIDGEVWTVRENANLDHNFAGLVLHVVQDVLRTFSLIDMYSDRVREAHLTGLIHIHDLGFGIVGYCAGWDLKELLLKGLGAPGQITSAPARHLGSALQIAVNALGVLQNEWAGAQAYSSFDTYMAPFVRDEALRIAAIRYGGEAEKAYKSRFHGTALVRRVLDRLRNDPEGMRALEKSVEQEVQQFLFAINTTSRWGGQAPFTNLTIDLVVPRDMRNQPAILDGQSIDTTYGDYQWEMDLFNRCYLRVMMQGDAQGRRFPFPIITYNVTPEFWDHPLTPTIMEMAGRYGSPYFANFVHPDVDMRPEDARSMCCRLRLDKRELLKRGGGLFGSAGLTGSLGVVTINLPRIARLARDRGREGFFADLAEAMEIAREALLVKKDLLEKMLASRMMPYSAQFLPDFNRHFMTIGLVGGNEACLNLLGVDIMHPEGHRLAKDILEFMRSRISSWQEEDGQLYNLEATPAEGASTRLARLDIRDFGPDIAHQGEGEGVYYSNSTMPAPADQDDLWMVLEHQKDLQVRYTGGTVLHIMLQTPIEDPAVAMVLLRRVMETYPVPYISLTPTYSVCPDHGYLPGEHWRCPKCGGEAEVYSRVVGYYRPVSRWNVGKRAEWTDRVLLGPEGKAAEGRKAA